MFECLYLDNTLFPSYHAAIGNDWIKSENTSVTFSLILLVFQAKIVFNNYDRIFVEVLDSLMGCDLGNICAGAGR
jgi:hypothetical protein